MAKEKCGYPRPTGETCEKEPLEPTSEDRCWMHTQDALDGSEAVDLYDRGIRAEDAATVLGRDERWVEEVYRLRAQAHEFCNGAVTEEMGF